MSDPKKCNLIYEVIHNIVMIDNENRVIFCGDQIRDKIMIPDKDSIRNKPIGCVLNPLIFDSQDISVFEQSLELIRANNHSQTLKLKQFPEELIVLHAHKEHDRNIIVSVKSKVKEIVKIELDLRERVKELECLYAISRELESNINLEEALQNSWKYLHKGLQFPEIASGFFEIDGVIYGNTDCDPGVSISCITTDITIGDQKRGRIQLCYSEREEFLNEEMKLLREISGKIAQAIERREKRNDLLNHNKALKKLTQEVIRSEEKLKTFFQAITDTIIVIDSDFAIRMSNNPNIKKREKCYKKLFNRNELCENCPAHHTFRTGEKACFEQEYKDHNFLLQSYPITNSDEKVERILEVCRDITKEKQIEMHLMQSYKLASIGKLVAGIAHEINNPNTFILGNIKIIKEALIDILPLLDKFAQNQPEMKIARLPYSIFKDHIIQLTDDMESGAQRMKKIVLDLKNFARKDKQILTDNVDINALIQNQLNIVFKEVKRQAEIQFDLAENLPNFLGNNQKLEQVLMNIILNASQALDGKKNGFIRIETAYLKHSNEILIKITDNGKGMDKPTRKNVFDPFFTTKRNKGGTGLGLSISYGIVREHKGRIMVESKLEKGTVFTIIIPVKS